MIICENCQHNKICSLKSIVEEKQKSIDNKEIDNQNSPIKIIIQCEERLPYTYPSYTDIAPKTKTDRDNDIWNNYKYHDPNDYWYADKKTVPSSAFATKIDEPTGKVKGLDIYCQHGQDAIKNLTNILNDMAKNI
jgi:hypothetical protein